MNQYVVDTHALFWYLTASPQLGGAAKSALEEGARGEATVYVPVIALAELYYLNVKHGEPLNFAEEYSRLQISSQFAFVEFAPDDVIEFDLDADVPEMHDRTIVGVSRRLGATCISRDAQLANGGLVPVVW